MLVPDVRRMDDIMLGVSEVLAHAPERGLATGRVGVFALTVKEPPLAIYYSYNDQFVDLLSIRRGGGTVTAGNQKKAEPQPRPSPQFGDALRRILRVSKDEVAKQLAREKPTRK